MVVLGTNHFSVLPLVCIISVSLGHVALGTNKGISYVVGAYVLFLVLLVFLSADGVEMGSILGGIGYDSNGELHVVWGHHAPGMP